MVPITAKGALLQVLISGKGYGLDLIERVKERAGIELGQGSVYPALRELEREGLVKSFETEPNGERGGRPRRYYELTAEGLRCAREQRESMLGLLVPGVV